MYTKVTWPQWANIQSFTKDYWNNNIIINTYLQAFTQNNYIYHMIVSVADI